MKSTPNSSIVIVLSSVLTACGSYVTLFNDSDLNGWQQVGDARWTVERGEIIAQGAGDGFLATEQEYGDFRLSLEFWVDASTNSGIFIRCRERGDINPKTCYELNIWDNHPRQEARTGSIVFKVMPPLAQVDTVGRWNTLDVFAEGSELTLRVNNVVTAVMDSADKTPGFIALQHFETGMVKFRNIRIGEL